MRTRINAAGESGKGTDRKQNKDSISLLKEKNLYFVCDGTGGRSGGTASTIAVEIIEKYFKENNEGSDMGQSLNDEYDRFETAVKLANLKIYEASKKDLKLYGMISTLAAAYFTNDGIYLANVGNSRIYRIREKIIEQVSEDHSLLNDYKKMKKLTSEEIQSILSKNVVVRALGMKDSVKVDVFFEDPVPGDTYLLCSDGLSNNVSDSEMLDIYLKKKDNLQSACHALIETAFQNGSCDNTSVILINVIDIE